MCPNSPVCCHGDTQWLLFFSVKENLEKAKPQTQDGKQKIVCQWVR